MKAKNIYPEYRGFSVEPSLFDLEKRPLDITKIVQKAVEYHANAIRFGFIGHTGLVPYPATPTIKNKKFLCPGDGFLRAMRAAGRIRQ